MSGAALTWRLGAGTLLGLALFWYAGRPVFGDRPLPDALLPCCLVFGWLWPPPRRWLHDAPAPGPRWVGFGVLLALGTLVGLIGWGALATPSRHWDGVAAWDVRAQVLAASPTLEQPLFRDPAVYLHSRDYPLLQPFAVAALERLLGAGRLWFPLLLAVLAALVGTGARRAGTPGWLPWVLALACAGTPMLVNPTSGAADSGHAELLLAVCAAAIALGTARDLPGVVALGAMLAIASKPEGLALAVLAILVALARGHRAQLVAAVGGGALGMLGWLQVHGKVCPAQEPPSWEYAAVVLVAGAILAGDTLLRAAALQPRGRSLLALSWAGALALAVVFLPVEWAAADTAVGRYLGKSDLLGERLASLPAIAGSFAAYATVRLVFGATFVLPVLAWLGLQRARRPLPEPLAATLAFVLLGMAVIALPFLLSPEPDLRHHLRSSMARLQLHWVGAAWILTAGLLHELLAAAPAPAPPLAQSVRT